MALPASGFGLRNKTNGRAHYRLKWGNGSFTNWVLVKKNETHITNLHTLGIETNAKVWLEAKMNSHPAKTGSFVNFAPESKDQYYMEIQGSILKGFKFNPDHPVKYSSAALVEQTEE